MGFSWYPWCCCDSQPCQNDCSHTVGSSPKIAISVTGLPTSWILYWGTCRYFNPPGSPTTPFYWTFTGGLSSLSVEVPLPLPAAPNVTVIVPGTGMATKTNVDYCDAIPPGGGTTSGNFYAGGPCVVDYWVYLQNLTLRCGSVVTCSVVVYPMISMNWKPSGNCQAASANNIGFGTSNTSGVNLMPVIPHASFCGGQALACTAPYQTRVLNPNPLFSPIYQVTGAADWSVQIV